MNTIKDGTINTADLVYENAITLGQDLHYIRQNAGDNIVSCAAKLKVSYTLIEELERGKCKQIEWNLLLRFAKLYQQKIAIRVGEDNV